MASPSTAPSASDFPPPFLVPRRLTPVVVGLAALVIHQAAGAAAVAMLTGSLLLVHALPSMLLELAILGRALHSRTMREASVWIVAGLLATRLGLQIIRAPHHFGVTQIVLCLVAALISGLAQLVLAASAVRLRAEPSHDVPDRALAVGGIWLVGFSALSATNLFFSTIPNLCVMGLGALATCVAVLDERRIRQWLARVRDGKEAGWTIVPATESDAQGLVPLIHAPHAATRDGVLRHTITVDGNDPYRGGNAIADVALVGLDAESDRALERWVARWARLGVKIALALGVLAYMNRHSGY